MKTATTWSYKHYLPLHLKERKNAPYICRIAPFADGFEFDIYDDCENSSYILKWKIRGEDTENVQELDGKHGKVDGLASDTDYAFRIERKDGTASTERLVRTGNVPGGVVNYLHPDDEEYAFSGRYLCSPSLIRLEDGTLLASMDLYASGAPQNLTLIFRSEDNGESWHYVSELFPCFWGN